MIDLIVCLLIVWLIDELCLLRIFINIKFWKSLFDNIKWNDVYCWMNEMSWWFSVREIIDKWWLNVNWIINICLLIEWMNCKYY